MLYVLNSNLSLDKYLLNLNTIFHHKLKTSQREIKQPHATIH